MAGEATLTNGYVNGEIHDHPVELPDGFSKVKTGIKVIIVGAGFGGSNQWVKFCLAQVVPPASICVRKTQSVVRVPLSPVDLH